MNKIEIDGNKYAVRFSTRSFAHFERLSNKPIGVLESSTGMLIDDMVTLCYCALVSGAKKEKKKLPKHVDREWLLDMFDEFPQIVTEFTNLMTKAVADQTEKK